MASGVQQQERLGGGEKGWLIENVCGCSSSPQMGGREKKGMCEWRQRICCITFLILFKVVLESHLYPAQHTIEVHFRVEDGGWGWNNISVRVQAIQWYLFEFLNTFPHSALYFKK